MSLLSDLLAATGTYRGTGDGDESGPFEACIVVAPVLDDLAVDIDYRAWDATEEKHHERSLLAPDMATGVLTLHIVCAELPGLVRLPEARPNVFANGAGLDGFDIEVHVTLDDGALGYAWHWAPPGAALAEQSNAVVRLTP